MDTISTVVRPLTLELIDASGTGTLLEAELRYDSFDPYAVAALFHSGGRPVRWVFSRELLALGVTEPAGDGDVHVWPCLDSGGRAVVMVELYSPGGEALLQARSGDVSGFLASTDDVVAPGDEPRHLDLDAVVGKLLEGTADAS